MRSLDQTRSAAGVTAHSRYDAVVVGAGPYGLSAAAHLLGHGASVAVFGKTAEFWRRHMPPAMRLRSHWWATSLSDPQRRFGIEQFLRETGQQRTDPLLKETFVDYVLWFSRHAVRAVEETYVSSVERRGDHFVITVEDGRRIHSGAVVMATGLSYYAFRPADFAGLPPGLTSHTSDHAEFSVFSGRQVLVIGGGQSALESAALLHEAGAVVDVVSRRPILWLGPAPATARTRFRRILAPEASIAPGWPFWVLDHLPYFFYRLPQDLKDACNRNCAGPAASDWLKDRVRGKVTLHQGRRIVSVKAAGCRIEVRLADGRTLHADHVILATGYKVDLHKLPMLHPSLRAEVDSHSSIPILTDDFQSSVRGLYFVGLPSVPAFGPLYRFVAGCGASASRVARSITENSRRPRRGHQARPTREAKLPVAERNLAPAR